MRPEVRQAYHVSKTLALHQALDSGNFAAFFRLVRGLPYLMACLAHNFFPAMWDTALRTLVTGAHDHQELTDELGVRPLIMKLRIQLAPFDFSDRGCA